VELLLDLFRALLNMRKIFAYRLAFVPLLPFAFFERALVSTNVTGNAHEEDIAHSTSWAFAQAVAGVVPTCTKSHWMKLPDDKISFHFHLRWCSIRR
jgi:hypothetical protein